MRRRPIYCLLLAIFLPMAGSRLVGEAQTSSTENSGRLEEIKGLIEQGHFTEAENRCRELRPQIVAETGEGSG